MPASESPTGPATIIPDPVTGEHEKNYSSEKHAVDMENVRGTETQYSLDKVGFQWIKSPAKHTSFKDEDEMKKEYYPESVDLIKKVTGASKVVIFDHSNSFRRNNPQTRPPVTQAHVDQTTKASIARVHRHIPADEVPALLKKRFQIINVWRPIQVPALEWPLALCDYRSVDVENDTLPVALVFPDREGETLEVKYNPNHKWKYLRGMTPEEAVIFKCFDSVQDGSVAVFAAHTAFEDPSTPADAPVRQSIELRALVFYD
ncbi:hypothetical protein DFP72DRAFT_886775 [Ephemerocybe angulata]|uniref:Methyltransferase n=1 Tax=Ephemerocybe angulata TaxID=980116 RepID=A0A8H6MAG9_9AGAR|nr:hypothetical protein DFP72DRAFT_886775 [Tulosesus angulatus]